MAIAYTDFILLNRWKIPNLEKVQHSFKLISVFPRLLFNKKTLTINVLLTILWFITEIH